MFYILASDKNEFNSQNAALSIKGRYLAKNAAKKFAAEKIDFDIIYTSNQESAIQAAQIISPDASVVSLLALSPVNDIDDMDLNENFFSEFNKKNQNPADRVPVCDAVNNVHEFVDGLLKDDNTDNNILVICDRSIATIIGSYFYKQTGDTSLIKNNFKPGEFTSIDTEKYSANIM